MGKETKVGLVVIAVLLCVFAAVLAVRLNSPRTTKKGKTTTASQSTKDSDRGKKGKEKKPTTVVSDADDLEEDAESEGEATDRYGRKATSGRRRGASAARDDEGESTSDSSDDEYASSTDEEMRDLDTDDTDPDSGRDYMPDRYRGKGSDLYGAEEASDEESDDESSATDDGLDAGEDPSEDNAVDPRDPFSRDGVRTASAEQHRENPPRKLDKSTRGARLESSEDFYDSSSSSDDESATDADLDVEAEEDATDDASASDDESSADRRRRSSPGKIKRASSSLRERDNDTRWSDAGDDTTGDDDSDLGAFADQDGTYVVEPNDNFWNISRKVYGTGAYFKALFEHNRDRYPSEDSIRAGDILSAPEAAVLEQTYPALAPKARKKPKKSGRSSVARSRSRSGDERTYVVKKGDTLFDIARAELGKAGRWSEIMNLNQDVLGEDFDYLAPGTELLLPADDLEPDEEDKVTGRPRSRYKR